MLRCFSLRHFIRQRLLIFFFRHIRLRRFDDTPGHTVSPYMMLFVMPLPSRHAATPRHLCHADVFCLLRRLPLITLPRRPLIFMPSPDADAYFSLKRYC